MTKTKKLISLLLAILMVMSAFSVVASAASVKITKCKATYSTTFTYTGKAVKPSVKLTYNGATLKKDTDYTVAYANNKEIGTGAVTLTGKGKYTGKVTYLFEIKLGTPSDLSASSVTATGAKISWKAVTGATKYAVYSYDSSAKKYTKLTTTTTTSAKITLPSAKKNSVCVKAYKGKDSGNYSSKLSVVTLPATPTVTLSGSATSVKISWKSVAGASAYKVYSYSSATKKFTVLESKFTGTSYTVSGLKSGSTYGFTVAAIATVSSKSVLGAKAKVQYVPTAPGKVSGVKIGTVTSDSASLSWTAVSGATGYAIYSYNSSTKAYTKLKTTTSNSCTVSGLAASTTYTFCVAAYRNDDGKTSTGSKSAFVAFTTLAKNYLSDFQKLVKDGKFTIKYSVDMEEGNVTAKSVCSGKTTATEMTTTMEGITGTVNTIYWGDKKSGYVYMSAMGLGFYQELNESLAKENLFDAAGVKAMFCPPMAEGATIFNGTATYNGKNCTTYRYYTTNGTFVTYYFNGSKLVQILDGGTAMKISSYSTTVNSGDLKTPSLFPFGYVKMDLL